MTTTLLIALNAVFAVGILALLTFVMTRATKLSPDSEAPLQPRREPGERRHSGATAVALLGR